MRRTRIGDLDLVGSSTLAELEQLSVEARDARLSPVDALLAAAQFQLGAFCVKVGNLLGHGLLQTLYLLSHSCS